MIDIDTSTAAVAKISDDLMMTARVGTDNVRHAQLMDDASNVINALQARAETAEAKLAKAVDALRVMRAIVLDTMKALMFKGRDELILADKIHKADDAARTVLAELENN
jgi:hypothetical protein